VDDFNVYFSLFLLYSGHFESFPAAVKCIQDVHYNLYDNEMKQLRALGHYNVVRYFASKSFQGLHYIAMEKGYCNLRQFMESHSDNTDILIKLLHDSCLGVQYLHRWRIVHRNINPSNILVVKDNNGFVGKLSDFTFSQTFPLLQSDWCSGPCGFQDFMPPEVLRALEATHCTKTDIYSLGITMFNILSRGGHPGGVESIRLYNVSRGMLNFDQWKVTTPPLIQFQSCIERMVCYEIQNRASIDFVLNHPWSWNSKKDLEFILATANYLASGTSDANSDREKLKEKLSTDLKMNEVSHALGWKGNLCKKVILYLENPYTSRKSPKKYNSMDYLSLIEFIRDNYQHFAKLPSDLKCDEVFGVEPSTYIKYFTERFPGLIPTVYMFLQNRKGHPFFRYFYEETIPVIQYGSFVKEYDKGIVKQDSSNSQTESKEPSPSFALRRKSESKEVLDPGDTRFIKTLQLIFQFLNYCIIQFL
jgi:serine/threonine protein kinase